MTRTDMQTRTECERCGRDIACYPAQVPEGAEQLFETYRTFRHMFYGKPCWSEVPESEVRWVEVSR